MAESSMTGNCRRLLSYAWPERWRLIWIFPIAVVSTAAVLLQPWPMKLLFDHALGGVPPGPALQRVLESMPGFLEPVALPMLIGLSSLGLYFASGGATAAAAWVWATAGRAASLRLSEDVFASLQKRSLGFHKQTPVGEVLACVMTDSRCVSDWLEKVVVAPALALFTIVAMAAMIARHNWALAWMALSFPAAIIAGSLAIAKSLRKNAELKREADSRLQAFVQQTLAGMSTIQASAQEDRTVKRFHELAAAQIKIARRGAILNSINHLCSGFLSAVARAVLVWIGVGHVLAGQLSIGLAAVFLIYYETMLGKAKTLGDFYPTWQALTANIAKVNSALEQPPEVVQKRRARPMRLYGDVRFEGITFGYEAGPPVLENISFEARRGQTVAIVSASGGGKTSLLNLIPRLADPWKGRVTVDGNDVRDLSLKSLRSQVSMVFQEPFLYPCSVAENIAWGCARDREQIQKAALLAGAHSFITRLPEGYDTILSERGGSLSGGMQQRLAIARAIYKDASILILDEPTSALDAQSEKDVLLGLEAASRGKTVFIVTHRLAAIVGADLIIVLDGGRLVEIGRHGELMRRGGGYARMQGAIIKAGREPTALAV